MTVTFTRNGKIVEYIPDGDYGSRLEGDPSLMTDILDIMATKSITLEEPGPGVILRDDTPLDNAIAAATLLDCDISVPEEYGNRTLIPVRERTVIGEETVKVSSSEDIEEYSENEDVDGDIIP